MYNKLGDTVLSSYEYTYDTVGNQTSKTDHTGKSITYIYDGLGRLEGEWNYDTGESVDYFYDASQNRSSMYVDNGEESYQIYYTYDANNRLTQERKYQNGTYTTIATYTYDDNGNLLTKTGADGTAAYTYNGFNQQTGYTVGTTASAYAYNAKGIRTAKSVGAERTSFLLDGGNVVTEVKNNAVSANYIRGTNLISKEADNSTSYYLYNAHGDVIGLTNNTGSVTKAYDYDAFGIEKNPNTADTNPFRYCGEYYDTETGKYYLRARYYDPANGRFTQADTWNGDYSDPLSLNKYTYCCNNPIHYIDPSGLRSEEASSKMIEENAEYIIAAAEEFGIDPAILAAIIYTEQRLNGDWKDDYLDGIVGFYGIADTSIGVSQVKISTAKLMEEEGYMPKLFAEDGGWVLPLIGFVHGTEQMIREYTLEDPEQNIRYAAAYLRYFIDRWEGQYPEIKGDVGGLATLYNQGERFPPHASPKPNEFGTAAECYYDRAKKLIGPKKELWK